MRLVAVFILMFTLVITGSTSSVYSQTTGDTESTKRWCEQKKDELKDRLTDLFLLLFVIPAPRYSGVVDMIDKANALATEVEQKSIDCADYLTGTETRTMESMTSAATFVACIGDILLTASSDPEAYNPEAMGPLLFACISAGV